MSAYRTCNLLVLLAMVMLPLQPASPSQMRAAQATAHLYKEVSGSITEDTTWTLAESPYVVTDNVTVSEGVTLTIESGVVVKFQDWYDNLEVNGRLVAQGTEVEPIVFTSLKDDAHGGDDNGDGSATSPEPWDWGTLLFNESSGGSLLEHTWIGYGGGSYPYTNVKVNASDVTIRNSEIAYAYGSGVYYAGFDATRPVVLTANTFISNTYRAAYADLSDEVVDVTLVDNTSVGSPYNGFAMQGTISGTVNYSGTSGFPFVVWNDVTVQEGAALGFSPGTVVKFEACWDNLRVNGSLVAQGTETEPIVFTSLRDDASGGDTNGDGAATNPAAKDWGGIYFNASSSGNLLEHTWIGYGGFWSSTLHVYTDDVTVRDSVIGWSGDRGIRMWGASPTIEGNTIRDSLVGIGVLDGSQPTVRENTVVNNQWGVLTSGGSQPVLRNNAICAQSGAWGVRNIDATVIVDAVNNWWGSPSGPYHATLNPFGEGDGVSDSVLFTPWLQQPVTETATIDELLVTLVGPSQVSPGQTGGYAIRYRNLTTQTVESAVLVVALPYGAEYVGSTGDGIHWPEWHQVFWKLDDLTPGSYGSTSVHVRFLWGLPEGLQDAALAVLGGTNLDADSFDVSPYLAYTPREILEETALSEADVEAERQAYPDLDTIYTEAIADGFICGNGTRLAVSSGEVITQLVLFQPDRQAVMYLHRQGDQVLASTFEQTSNAVRDATGGMTRDLLLDTVEYWGDWAPATSGLSVQAGVFTIGHCFWNCIRGNIPGWIIGKKFKLIGSILNIESCVLCVAGGGAVPCGKCAGALKNVPGVGEAIDTLVCATDCISDTKSHLCTEIKDGKLIKNDKVTCVIGEGFWYWLGYLHSEKREVCMDDGSYRPLAERDGCNYVCLEGRGCVSCAELKRLKPQAVAIAQEGRPPAATLCELLAASDVGCSLLGTTVRVARDPNEKFGLDGNLLPGQMVTYTITYENEGEGYAYGVFVVDELDEHYDENTLTIHGGGQFITDTRTLLWSVGELTPKGQVGSQGTLSFTVKLKDGLPGGTVISNQAIVYFPSVPEETPTNSVVNVIQPVVALPQWLETEAGQPVAITLQGVEVSGAPLTYAVEEEPLYGDLTGVAPSLVYTPMVTYSGLDRLTFRVSNGITQSQPAEVSILVNPWSGDTTPPEILWTEPDDGSAISEIRTTPVLTDTVGPAYAPFVLVQFSEVVSTTTVTTETVQIVDDAERPISATVEYDGVLNRAVIVLREPLQDDTQYTVAVNQGVKDLMGNPMEDDYTWSFQTGSAGEEAIEELSATNDGPTPLGQATTFTATVSAGTDESYAWGFGDGETASGAVATHTYLVAGQYTAAVTATNSVNVVTATTSVTVEEAIAGLSATNDGPTPLGQATTLTAIVTAGTDVSYAWALGDGNTDEGPVVAHIYAGVGQYTAVVTATNSVSVDSTTTTVTVHEIGQPPESGIYLPLVVR